MSSRNCICCIRAAS